LLIECQDSQIVDLEISSSLHLRGTINNIYVYNFENA
jgi:hypothetical protein